MNSKKNQDLKIVSGLGLNIAYLILLLIPVIVYKNQPFQHLLNVLLAVFGGILVINGAIDYMRKYSVSGHPRVKVFLVEGKKTVTWAIAQIAIGLLLFVMSMFI